MKVGFAREAITTLLRMMFIKSLAIKLVCRVSSKVLNPSKNDKHLHDQLP